jgi:hypothetical protein
LDALYALDKMDNDDSLKALIKKYKKSMTEDINVVWGLEKCLESHQIVFKKHSDT